MNRYREKDVQIVKELGERIGYGNLIDIASTLWAKKLTNSDVSLLYQPGNVRNNNKKERGVLIGQ